MMPLSVSVKSHKYPYLYLYLKLLIKTFFPTHIILIKLADCIP